jgi:acyl dehydratase
MSELLHFEDFVTGQAFILGPHAMTKAEILEFAHEFDWLPFHTDEEAAKQSILGGLAASGWHSSAILMRMMCDACLKGSTVVGSDGVDEVKWRSPVLVGDVLSGSMTITGKSDSHPTRNIGTLNFTSKLANQMSVIKIEVTGRFFVRKRPS